MLIKIEVNHKLCFTNKVNRHHKLSNPLDSRVNSLKEMPCTLGNIRGNSFFRPNYSHVSCAGGNKIKTCITSEEILAHFVDLLIFNIFVNNKKELTHGCWEWRHCIRKRKKNPWGCNHCIILLTTNQVGSRLQIRPKTVSGEYRLRVYTGYPVFTFRGHSTNRMTIQSN